MSHYDVAILGGGPAGTATGLELRRNEPGLRVLLVEAEISTGWQIGETLAPGAKQLLNGFGCWSKLLRDGMLEAWRAGEAIASARMNSCFPYVAMLGTWIAPVSMRPCVRRRKRQQ
jgi:2-polyprenyl-6-methoxyphenol hydroxylase-like FAD-dependent oxidoreductase